MAIPSMDDVMLPVLRLVLNKEMQIKECVKRIADHFDLANEERNETIPSGRITKVYDRVTWAICHLNRAGLVERPRRGYVIATDFGRNTCKDDLERITTTYLSRFPAYREWRQSFGSSPGEEPSHTGEGRGDARESDDGSPRERLEVAYSEMSAALREELLSAVRNSSPEFFERLVISLMHAMNYGEPGTGRHLGRSRDQGVDGLIPQDPLGLDIIYLQAKRWKDPVDARQVRDFLGALDTHGANKGVIITTSAFTKDAKETVDSGRSSKQVKLIDGEKLAHLLVDHNVGVVEDGQPLAIKKIDENYFSESE